MNFDCMICSDCQPDRIDSSPNVIIDVMTCHATCVIVCLLG